MLIINSGNTIPHQQVMDWWQKMMPRQGKPSFDDIKLHREKKLAAGGPDPEKTDRVMLVRNRVSRIYYKMVME